MYCHYLSRDKRVNLVNMGDKLVYLICYTMVVWDKGFLALQLICYTMVGRYSMVGMAWEQQLICYNILGSYSMVGMVGMAWEQLQWQ